MTIQNLHSYTQALWDYGVFDECFPRNMKMTDVDGLIEINGFFSLFEFGRADKQIRIGQKIMHDRLVEQVHPRFGIHNFTIWNVWGMPPDSPKTWELRYKKAFEKNEVGMGDLMGLKKRIFKWADWADKFGRELQVGQEIEI